ncbi:MAG: hypothetical protein CMK00_06470 [Planctomycetes bacterium]|nr:hypothetical protein [Planctomycetota bacterium]
MPGAREIKGNVKRTVLREPGGPGQTGRAVKRFHAPGHLDSLRDGARARAEGQALETAASRGLPVPRVLEVVRRAAGTGQASGGAETGGNAGTCGGAGKGAAATSLGDATGERWELCTEWIPDAHSLADILAGHCPWPAGRRQGLKRLGHLLAHVYRAGLHHPDLHPGNALIDDTGQVWLVDLHGATFTEPRAVGGRAPDARWSEHLASLCAATRELLTAGERALCLGTMAQSLGWEAASSAPDTWRYEIEDRARQLRQQQCARRRRVWLRTSSPTLEFEVGACSGLRRRDLDQDQAADWLTQNTSPAPSDTHAYIGFAFESKQAARAAWTNAARLEEHRLPAARPACYDADGARALFRIPRACQGPAPEEHPQPPCPSPAALGHLLGSLHDRALSVPMSLQALLQDQSDGALLLAPPVQLHAWERAALWPELKRAGATLGVETLTAPAFRAAFLAALRHSRSERRHLEASWGRG